MTPITFFVNGDPKPQRSRANWCGLERLIEMGSPLVSVRKMNAEAIRIPGGKVIAKRGPCDFWGVVVGSGRAIVLDAKSCDQATRFPIGNVTHFPDHQRRELVLAGRSGAVAGLLVAGTHEKVAALYWISWQDAQTRDKSIPWTDPRMQRIGALWSPIRWERIVAASSSPPSPQPTSAAQ
jgi:hypothetical protein